MRHVRLTVGLAMAVCAAACIAAVPAMAETGKFHAYFQTKRPITTEKPANIKGLGTEESKWTFGGPAGYNIVCHKTGAKGKMTEPFSETLQLDVLFSKCFVVYTLKFGEHYVKNEYAARFSKEGIALIYHNNGFVEALGGESGEEIEYTEGHKVVLLPVAASWTLPGKTEPECVISLPEQTIPTKAIKEPNGTFSAAVYENQKEPIVSKYYPLGYKERLNITNDFKFLKFKFTAGKCAEETESRQGNRGTYNGSYLNEVIGGGNLAFEP